MKRSGVGGFVGDVRALLGVEGLRDAVKVKAFFTELLEKMGHEDRLRYASGGNKTCHACFSRPLGGLDCTM